MSRVLEGSHLARLRHGCGSVVLENRSLPGCLADERAAMESAWAGFVQTRVGSAKRYAAITGCPVATAEKRRLGALPQPGEFGGLVRAFGTAWIAAIARDHLTQFIQDQEAQTHDARQALAALDLAAGSDGEGDFILVAEAVGPSPVDPVDPVSPGAGQGGTGGRAQGRTVRRTPPRLHLA